jgi:hypothetical protein
VAKLKAFILVSFLILVSCATKTVNEKGLSVLTEDAYAAIIDKWSDRVEDYNGLNNTITVWATVINPEVIRAQLDHNARMFQWDQTQLAKETDIANEKYTKQTEVFVSFYSPERKWDDLAKSKTLWKVFLDANGQRYEGKAVKVKLLTREIQSLYPYHTAYGTPYLVSFPLNAQAIDGKVVKLIITGSIGSVTLLLDGQ